MSFTGFCLLSCRRSATDAGTILCNDLKKQLGSVILNSEYQGHYDSEYQEAIFSVQDKDVAKVSSSLEKWRFQGRTLRGHDLEAILKRRLKIDYKVLRSEFFQVQYNHGKSYKIWIIDVGITGKILLIQRYNI
jgi:hypothetical protein